MSRVSARFILLLIVLLAITCFIECANTKATRKPRTPRPSAPFGISLPRRKGILELTVTSTIIWISAFFFVVWALVQVLQFVLTRGYTNGRGVVPRISLNWFSLLKLSYNSQSDDLRRKINAYFLKGIIYPTGLAFSTYSLGVLYAGNNVLTVGKVVHIEVLRAMTVFFIGMMIFEILYRTHSSFSMIIHHWAAVLDCILVLYWDYENLAFLKIAAIFAIFVALEGPECYAMIFYRAFADTKALSKDDVQNVMNKYLDMSNPGFGSASVMRQFARYKQILAPFMLFVAISDLLLKFIQHIIVLVLYVTYWNELSIELRIIFGGTFAIFIVVQLYSPYIYTMIWLKLRKEIAASGALDPDEEQANRFNARTEIEYNKLETVEVHNNDE